MSSGAEVFKEFLVSLGFKVDEAGLKKFNAGIAGGTRLAMGFGTAVTAMAVAVVTGVGTVSRKFEELYYLSQRVGSSAENINALGFAFSQLGGNAGQAKGAVAALQDFIKLLPGGEGVIKGLGVETRGANGELRDNAEILLDLANRWKGMDLAQANVEAGMLGIDTETLRVLTRDTDKFFENYKTHVREAGVDQEAAAAASARLMQGIREVWAIVVIAADAFLLKFQPSLQLTVDTVIDLYRQFLTWNAGSSESRKVVGELLTTVLELVAALVGLAQTIWRLIGPALIELTGNGLRVLTDVLSLVTHLIKGIAALLRGDWSAAWKEAKEVASSALKTVIDTAMTLIKLVKRVWYAVAHKGAEAPTEAAAPSAAPGAGGTGGGGSPPPAAGASAITTGTPIKQALDYFRSKGWSGPQAAGIVANLQSESGMRTGAVGDGGKAFGIAQWHPDRQAAFKRWAGKDIRNSSFAEQLAFVHYELTQGNERAAGTRLKGATTARAAGGVVARYYERPADTVGEMAKRGDLAERLFGSPALRSTSPSISVAQTTTILVPGSSDPGATARAVGAEQARVNSDLVRNVKVSAS